MAMCCEHRRVSKLTILQEFANHRLLSRSHNIRWLFVNQDYDGRTHMDDSYNLLVGNLSDLAEHY